MKKMFFAFVILFTTTFVFTLSAQNRKSVVGKWKYEVAEAPYGYTEGTIEIKALKETLTGEVNFNSGQVVKMQKLTMRNDTIWGSMYVDSENVKLTAKISNSKMKGSVNTSMGEMSLKADKVVDKK